MKRAARAPTAPVLNEEFRRLVLELGAVAPKPRNIVVAGVEGGEGATTIAANLAFALSRETNSRVLLIDANLRRPTLHRLVGGQLARGWLEWDGNAPLVPQPVTWADNLFFLPATDAEPTLAASTLVERCARVAQAVSEAFDYVVWDSAAVTSGPESAALGAHTDGVLLVIEMDRTRRDSLRFVRDSLARSGARLIGAVTNRNGRFWPLRAAQGQER